MFSLESVGLLALLLLCIGALAALTYPGVWPQEGATLDAGLVQTALAVSTLRLFKNPLAVGSNTTVADFIEATYTGYAAQALATVPAPVNDATLGGVSIFVPSHLFTCSLAPVAPETIHGWWLEDTTGKCVAAGNFTTPFVITNIGDTVPLQVTLNFQSAGLTAIANIL